MLYSETVLGKLMNSYKLKIIRTPFKFKRIRCDGKCERLDISL